MSQLLLKPIAFIDKMKCTFDLLFSSMISQNFPGQTRQRHSILIRIFGHKTDLVLFIRKLNKYIHVPFSTFLVVQLRTAAGTVCLSFKSVYFLAAMGNNF